MRVIVHVVDMGKAAGMAYNACGTGVETRDGSREDLKGDGEKEDEGRHGDAARENIRRVARRNYSHEMFRRHGRIDISDAI